MSEEALLFGRTAVERGFITPDQLDAALARQRQEPTLSLGEVLVGQGAITAPQANGIEKLRVVLQREGSRAKVYGEAEEDLAGMILGGCLVLERLAIGSMGTTYRAHHLRLDRDVAVKVLHTRLVAIEGNLERFAREARAAAHLEHPAIVSVYDFDSDQGYHFIVMQYVRGQDLREVLESRGALGPRRGLWIGARVLEGLAHAHGRKLVHRDIKPANLLITPEPQVKIADFGLVRVLSRATSSDISTFGEIIGTPQYMPPEQACGDDFDHRADLYALGITLFELIAGRPPFSGSSTMEVLELQIVAPLPDLRETVPDASPELQAFLERMCAKSMDDRFASAGEALTALQALRFDGTTRRFGGAQQAADPSRRVEAPGIVTEEALQELKSRLRRSRSFVAFELEEDAPEGDAPPNPTEAARERLIEASFQGLEVSSGALGTFRRRLAEALADPEARVPPLLYEMLKDGHVEEVLALEKDLEAALPTSAAVSFFLGIAYERQDRLEEARAKIALAVVFSPDHLPARLHLARLLVALGRVDDAIETLREANRWHPSSTKAAIRLAEVLYMVKGDAEAAVPAYERAIELVPTQWQLRQQLAWILYELGRYDRAEAVLEEVIAWKPDAKPAEDLLAQVRQKRAREQASRTGAQARAQEAETDRAGPGPQTSAALQAIRLAEASGRHDRAAQFAQRGLEGRPRSVPLLLALARAHVRSGEHAKALASFGEVLAIDAENEEAQAGLREAQEASGQAPG